METTTLMLLPVCECGNIIAGLEIDKIVDVDGWKCRRPFSLIECPRCKRLIESISIDNQYLKAFGCTKENSNG